MNPARRAIALFSILSFGWTAFIGPLADAIWYHAGAESVAVRHIESAEGLGCHAERCAMGAPVASVSPLATGIDVPRFELGNRRVNRIQPDDSHLDRLPLLPAGSRAPPA